MTALHDELEAARKELAADLASGTWSPAPDDVLAKCEFLKVGFRAWGLEARDKSWRLDLSRLDFGASDPTVLLTVTAPNHPNAFGDLNWLVFSHTFGVNGGNNFTQCLVRLTDALGGSKGEWGRMIIYLIGKARQANAGANNGTFSITGRPVVGAPPPYVFDQRMRQGRTMSIFGPGSAGKTTLVDGLVASACSGHEVVPGWRPVREFKVLVLDWDEGAEEEMIRLAAICDAHQIELTTEYHYKRQTRPLHDVADEIGAYIVANGIEIVIVSPMGRAQRNFGENITAPVDEVHEILRSFGTTNILIDHVTGDNIKGGAQREFGSVRKRDNVRGSYGIDVQSEEPGTRVLVLRNTKADALSPRQPDQAVRIEFVPPWPKQDGTYDTITFHPDEVLASEFAAPAKPIKDVLYDLLATEHLTIDELAERSRLRPASVKTTLYQARINGERLFNRLGSDKWERLPISNGVTGNVTAPSQGDRGITQ